MLSAALIAVPGAGESVGEGVTLTHERSAVDAIEVLRPFVQVRAEQT